MLTLGLDSTFHVTATPALTTWLSVTSQPILITGLYGYLYDFTVLVFWEMLSPATTPARRSFPNARRRGACSSAR